MPKEVPEYEKVRKEYAGRAVEFIALTAEDPNTSSNRVRQFVRDMNFGFRMGWADRETATTLMNGRTAIRKPSSSPQTVAFSATGAVTHPDRDATAYARRLNTPSRKPLHKREAHNERAALGSLRY